MAKRNYITKEERNMRLCQYDRDQLYSLLLKESGLKDKQDEARQRITEYVEGLVWKRILGDESCTIFPGCYRICKTIQGLSIVFKGDFGIEVPKFEKKELIGEIDDYIFIELSKPIPDIFEEKPYYQRNSTSFYTENRFASRIKKLASREELKTLENLIYEYISVCVDFKSYLKEFRTPSRASWKHYDEFGKFFNLGQLYDQDPVLAFKMKYDVFKIEDPEDRNQSLQDLEKHPSEFSIEQNIERLKAILDI